MTGSTKILTVSYGTFSCTLEGFDDPFGTMRGIAEYFRDLAADDRYFGAEPPTPDVEMLQRIAEKEVQRRVEARLGEGGVALTQLTSDEAKAPVAAEQPVKAKEVRTRPEPEQAEEDSDRGPLAHEDEYLLSDEPEDVLAVDPDARPLKEGPAETVAEKLRRIRAVVSRSIEPEAEKTTGSFREAQARIADENQAAPRRERALTETIRQITADLSDDEEAPKDSADEDNFFEADEAAAQSAENVVSDDFDGGEEDNLFEANEAASPSAESAVSDDFEDALQRAEATAEVDTVSGEEADDGWDIDLGPPGEDVAASADNGAVQDDGGWDIDIEAPAETEDLQEDEPDDVAASNEMLSRVLARKDKVETSAEVLRLEQENHVPGPKTERRTSRPLTPISDSNGDVGRLLAETDNHLNDDESVRRRRVISQMRAAVAATKADRIVSRRVTSRADEDAVEQERYRDDLSEAVRDVTRPLPGKNLDRRPTAAPLILVSSQRVDATITAASSHIEIRQQSGQIEDFAGFAKSMGARELTDLLEAAAAYTSFVEGQSSFSRPEIMKRVARVDPSLRLSREDGLRSFGQLLRQGKFRKLERGQFTIADSTRFKPERRVAGE